CNRDPNDQLRAPHPNPEPYRFGLGSHSFDISPLPYTESFRFLGVWFTLSLNQSYVKKQCAAEYNLFASKLRHKRLTSDQLLYLHNMVLLPKVDFRLKTTLLSEGDCNSIMSPFKRTFKRALKLCINLPSALLHFDKAFGLINLYQRQITNHSANFSKKLDMDADSITKRLLDHRIHAIQKDIHIPFSPLLLTDFSSFTKIQRYKTDYIFRLLIFASKLGIAFARPPPDSMSVRSFEKHTPIHTIFNNDSIVYAKNLRLLKKHNITHLSDCISKDGLCILPFKDI